MDEASCVVPCAPSSSLRALAEKRWSSRLAAAVSGALGCLGLSGLWNFLAPFSLFSQLLLLAHVLSGLGVTTVVVPYVARHVRTWARQRVTASMFLGYALAAVVLVSLASGVWLGGEALWSRRMTPAWDLTHLVSGLAVLGLVGAHLAAAVQRRWAVSHTAPALAAAMRVFARRQAVLVVGIAGPVACVALAWPRADLRFDPPEGYTLPGYAQAFDEYRGNPFAPTYARTDDLRMVAPELMAGSASCGRGGCHEQVLAEWQPRAHRFAAMNPPFQEVQRRFAEDREPADTRYCAGCHDPISLFAGAKDLHSQSLSAPGVEEGISCVACHSISQVDERGNADYVVSPPTPYLWESAPGWRGSVGTFLVRTYPRHHLADYDRNLLRTPEFCAACHKQFIPEALNRFGLVEGQNQFDEWRNGHWHSEDPESDLSCRDCHMRLVESQDPGRGEAGDRRRAVDDRRHRHHGFIATNNFMPAVLGLPHSEEHVRLTEAWMRGETVLPEIADLWPEGPVAGLSLIVPASAGPGQTIDVRAVVSNRKAGHNFVTGPLDFIRSWIHLEILDADGRVLAAWGQLDPETRHIVEGDRTGGDADGARGRTLVLEATPVDEHGEELRRHELCRKAGGRGRRVIFPLYSDSQSYRFTVPVGTKGPRRIQAELNYRRYRQEFLDLVLPDLEESSGVYQPTVRQATASASVRLSASGGD